ncbi:MAG: VWA domain-containing protein, partial [Pseudomonadota bacterium]
MDAAERWYHASLAGALSLIAGSKLGGIRLMAAAGPVRTIWLQQFETLLHPEDAPIYVPASTSAGRLTGGISMAKSLAAGVPRHEAGLLKLVRGRALIVNMAERLELETAALIAEEMDRHQDGFEAPRCIVLLDEGETVDETPPAILTERVALPIDLSGLSIRDAHPFEIGLANIASARERLLKTAIDDHLIDAIVAACATIGLNSMRLPLFCVHTAKSIAALRGRTDVEVDDIALSCRLVLPNRAEGAEPNAPQQNEPMPSPEAPSDTEQESIDKQDIASSEDLETLLIETVMADAGAALSRQRKRRADRKSSGAAGRSGDIVFATDKGRPERTSQRRTDKGRVDLIATLRNAAPFQKVRQHQKPQDGLAIRRSDLRMKRFRRRKQSSVIFVVDASGSSALNRLAEAKGAATHLLSDCYARRDLVSLISFRGQEAELVLSPTRSLVKAKRQLTDLPGGGATPLADAIACASRLAEVEGDRGRTPVIVFLSDGRGNMTLDGAADRTKAGEETKLLARKLASKRLDALFFDTSRR